jgi:hypothetical protein
MNNADIDRTGDIALDFDVSARFHFIQRASCDCFSERPVNHCSCGGDRLQQDHRLPRQLFQADLSKGKAHAPARTSKVSLGRNQRNPLRSTKECGTGPWPGQRHLKAPSRLHRRGFWRECLIRCEGTRRGSGQSSADRNKAASPEPPERFPAEIGGMIFSFFFCLLDRVEHLRGFNIDFTVWRQLQLASLMIEKR